jgi:hypothetical protein
MPASAMKIDDVFIHWCRYPHHMPPKTPNELRKQIEAQQNEPASPGHERTAEGEEVETPSESEFMGNLQKVARKPKQP